MIRIMLWCDLLSVCWGNVFWVCYDYYDIAFCGPFMSVMYFTWNERKPGVFFNIYLMLKLAWYNCNRFSKYFDLLLAILVKRILNKESIRKFYLLSQNINNFTPFWPLKNPYASHMVMYENRHFVLAWK